MLEARKCHGTAVLDGKLYVMGGSDQQLSVLSAECLDLSLPEDQWMWRPIAPLPSWHNGNYAPVINNNLYLPVAYGSDTDKSYNPSTDLWLAWEAQAEWATGFLEMEILTFQSIIEGEGFVKNLL